MHPIPIGPDLRFIAITHESLTHSELFSLYVGFQTDAAACEYNTHVHVTGTHPSGRLGLLQRSSLRLKRTLTPET
ncbi:hypothetical protein SCLCIDRAFT_1206998 [Scleroderma citrinum Foug A]|uniref:Uncharacterized protein n=1 Tax=Scleroderma citrinum Foug A TaxID=1036808 RepID=A0A0C3EDS9_9AGAM|nr:hypothetical protein SCLCIDRAFT_1206998 [Scleroderma citrinum Foug A]